MTQVKPVRVAFANLRHPVAVTARLAESLGSQDQPVVGDFEFDVAADRLDVERLVAVPVDPVGLTRCGWRGQFIDQRQQAMGFQVLGVKPE